MIGARDVEVMRELGGFLYLVTVNLIAVRTLLGIRLMHARSNQIITIKYFIKMIPMIRLPGFSCLILIKIAITVIIGEFSLSF